MRMNVSRTWVLISLMALALILIGSNACTMGSGASLQPNSHFVYPNSNVKPIGHTQGKASKLCGILIFNFGAPDGNLIKEARDQALAKSGGDLLINYTTDASVFMLPPLFTICKATVAGTAAKMEVGKQELR
jgi:hypothetical protein